MAAEGSNKPREQKQLESRKPQEFSQNGPEKKPGTSDIQRNPGDFVGKDKVKRDKTRQLKEDRQKRPTTGTPLENIPENTILSQAAQEQGSEKISQPGNQQTTQTNNQPGSKPPNTVRIQEPEKKFRMHIATMGKPKFDMPNPDPESNILKLLKDPHAMTLRSAEAKKSENTGQVPDARQTEKTGPPTEKPKIERRLVGDSLRRQKVEVYQKEGVEYIRYEKNGNKYEEHQEIESWTYNHIEHVHDEKSGNTDDKQVRSEEVRLIVRVRDVTSKNNSKYRIESIEGEKLYSTGGEVTAYTTAKHKFFSSNASNERTRLIRSILLNRLNPEKSEEEGHETTAQTTNQQATSDAQNVKQNNRGNDRTENR